MARSAELNHAEQLKNQHADALHRLNELLRSTERLLNQEFTLPETTDINEANAATSAYRKQLEDARAALIEKARADYLVSLTHFSAFTGMLCIPFRKKNPVCI